jgi:hypothetical protein
MMTSDQHPDQYSRPEPADVDQLAPATDQVTDAEAVDEVDHMVGQVTDAHVQARLRTLLAANGYVHPDDVPEPTHLDPAALDPAYLEATADFDPAAFAWGAQLDDARRELHAVRQEVRRLTETARQAEQRAADVQAGADAYVDEALDRARAHLDEARAEADEIIADAYRRAQEIIEAAAAQPTPAAAQQTGFGALVRDLLDEAYPQATELAPPRLLTGSVARWTSVRLPAGDIDLVPLLAANVERQDGAKAACPDRGWPSTEWSELRRAFLQWPTGSTDPRGDEGVDVAVRAERPGTWLACQVKSVRTPAAVPRPVRPASDCPATSRLFLILWNAASAVDCGCDVQRPAAGGPYGVRWLWTAALTDAGLWTVHPPALEQAGPAAGPGAAAMSTC